MTAKKRLPDTDGIGETFDEAVKNNGNKVTRLTVGKPKRIIPVSSRSNMGDDDTQVRDRKESPNYSDDAMLRLVNFIYDPMSTALLTNCGIDPDEAHLLGLTRINSSREAWMWAQQIMKEAAFKKYVYTKPPIMSLTQIRRIVFLLARRSIPGDCGPGFMLGVGLAQEQNITKSEDEPEGESW